MKNEPVRGETRLGDYHVICDRSGFKCWASQTVVQWDGLRVFKPFAEERQPQDFVRGVKDDQTVWNPRPEGTDTFLAPGDVTPEDL